MMQKTRNTIRKKMVLPILVVLVVVSLAACTNLRPIGIIYTNIRLPLTTNLHNTPVPVNPPNDGRTIEIRAPMTGVGVYAQVDSNAIGDIARSHGMQECYFADRQIYSILGIWTANKTILYGK